MPVAIAGGTPGSGGLVPRMVALEPPHAGNPSMTVGIDNALGGATAIFVFGAQGPRVTNPFAQPAPFLSSPRGPFRFATVLGGTGPGAGWGSVSVALPDSPGLVGRELYGQWFVLDRGAPDGVSASTVVRFTIF